MNKTKFKYSDITPLPSTFLIEQAVLNILLTNPSVLREIISVLKKDFFYFTPHKLIYETLQNLVELNIPITLTTVITKLQDKNILDEIGGIEKITTIINKFESVANLESYLFLLNEKHLRRSIIELGKKSIIWGYSTSIDINEILEKMDQLFHSLAQQKLTEKIYSSAEIIDDVFNEMKMKIKKQNEIGFLSSFKDLDSILQGFQKNELIIIAGRPSMGKTAFSLNLGKNIVTKYRVPLIIFSLEMSRQQIIYRLIADESNISTSRIKSGKMTVLEWKLLSSSMKNLAELPIYIDDTPNITLTEISSKLKKILNNKKKEGIVIIDYLQLMKLNVKFENRVQEISYITRNLKLLAKEFEIPILLLSQLSRNVESRTNKRPMLSDLRESGCLFQKTTEFRNSLKSWKTKTLIPNNVFSLSLKGIKPVYSLIFENNVEIYLTGNHKILGQAGWIKISELRNTDKIYCLLRNQTEIRTFNFFYHKLKKINYHGIKKVYDETIPFYHNYLNNNFILHNSIEQDADVVIMLYREDYYTETKEKAQITEFIIAKNRNGPVGTAKLVFDAGITTFKNA
jgi:replicative DNA helicase